MLTNLDFLPIEGIEYVNAILERDKRLKNRYEEVRSENRRNNLGLKSIKETKTKVLNPHFAEWIYSQTTHQMFQNIYYLYKDKDISQEKFNKFSSMITMGILNNYLNDIKVNKVNNDDHKNFPGLRKDVRETQIITYSDNKNNELVKLVLSSDFSGVQFPSYVMTSKGQVYTNMKGNPSGILFFKGTNSQEQGIDKPEVIKIASEIENILVGNKIGTKSEYFIENFD